MNALSIACVCASNMNRSMYAHYVLQKSGYNVHSFGTKSNCKLPGPSPDKPNIYQFGTPYSEIYSELLQKNKKLYESNGVLAMVKRNSEVKNCPEKWQTRRENFDIVFTYEMSVFDAVKKDMEARRSPDGDIVRVFDLDVEDTHEDSQKGAYDTLEFMKLIDECYARQMSWEENIDVIVSQFQAKTGRTVHYAIYFARP